MQTKVWKILFVVFIAIFVLSATNARAAPTMSSLAGTYVEQTSSGTGYTIILYDNGTGVFSGHSGTWTILNSTTFEGSYYVLGAPTTSYFTVGNNGFTSVLTGNVYVKTASASSSPTTSTTVSPTTSAVSTPNILEFSSTALTLLAVAAVAVTLCTLALVAKKRYAKVP